MMRLNKIMKKMNRECQRHLDKNMEMGLKPEKSTLSRLNVSKIKLSTDVWPNVFKFSKSNKFLMPNRKNY